MNKNITQKISRVAMTLLMLLAMSLTASATNFITDVMVAGHSNQSQFNTLIQNLQQQGWTDINQDLNQGCGSSSYYIHLLYKTQNSTGNTGVPITDFYIRTGANPPDYLTYGGRTYYLVPCQGNDNFVNGHGDLNAGCGSSSDYIFLYYTKDALSNNTGVTAITFNTTQSGAVGSNGGTTGYDLNSGAGGAYIYMHLTTASGANVVTLSSGSGNVQLRNNHILTGTGGTETQVTIADGATVTFNGVNNTAIPDNSSHQWSGISCLGNATIVLNGSTTNSVKGGRGGSGIHVAANKTLTIQGSGTLNATGGYRGAGIGGGWGSSCGNIAISGGTVTATGGDSGAGIGSGYSQSSCGNITISGGTVTATGGQSAAGIGSGYYNSSCGNITITNGVTRVTATKGQSSNNAVGAGNSSTCGTVTIGGVQTGNITMSPFVTYPYTVAFDSNGGTGTMNNQSFMYNVAQNLTANAFSNTGRQFIGWATSANGNVAYTNGQSVINLTSTYGATVTLFAKWGNTVTLTSQIGEVLLQDGEILTGTGGQNTHVKIADGATVTFNGVNNTAIANDNSHQWPGIGCLGDAVIVLSGGTTNSVKGGYRSPGIHVAANKTLTIQGSGTLNATGRTYATGIGGGWGSSCGDITISGGTVTATGDYYAAGIGSGYNQSSCGNITISGGTVNATGGDHSAGIGSGFKNSSCGNITITNGVTRVTVTKGQSSNNSIGAGDSSTCGTVTIGDVQTGNITMSPFVTYPYTVAFDSNGGSGSMADMSFMYNVARSLTANSFTRTGYLFEGWATSANGNVAYTNGQSVSNLTQISGDTVTLFAKWTVNPNDFSVSGDEYTIHTASGWDVFCDLLAENSNGFFTGKTVKLDTDISVTRMAGSSGHEFSGTFDGQSHTLTVSYQNTDNDVRTAPFSYVSGATIQNLIVAGNITGTANRAAGIVGETGNSLSHVTNCLSSVNVSGGQYTAGISIGGKVEITGCVFNGTIIGTNMSGGFVGYSNSALVISDCLFAPQQGSTLSGGTFYFNGGGDITPVNSYYTMPLGTPQGKQAHSIAGGEYVTVAFSGQATAYGTSGIDAYNVGVVYDSTPYAGQGETVSLNLGCTPPPGYTCSGFSASAGTLTGTANPYTLTMPNADVTLQAVLESLSSVNYIDGDGVVHTCNNFTILTGDETTLETGWYVADRDLTYNSTLTLNGDVTLILCNGKTMTVTADNDSGIMGDTLTIYGQSLDSTEAGTLNIICDGLNDAIFLLTGAYTQHSGKVNISGGAISTSSTTINGGSIHANGWGIGLDAANLTINGGTINAIANNVGGLGIFAEGMIINGGIIYAIANDIGGRGIHAEEAIIVNGGIIYAIANDIGGRGIHAEEAIIVNGGIINAIVNASGGYGICTGSTLTINGGKVEASSIYAGDSITIGWTTADDYILAGSYETDGGIISVKSGQAFYYDNVIVSGTLNNDQINAISGKTLRPYIEPCLPPFNLEVTDIRDNEATLHWTGDAESYNVSYYKTFFFDSFEEDLSQWTIYHEGDPGSLEWGIENPHDNSADLNAHSGYYAAVAYSDFDIHADNWLVTPQIQFPSQTTLKFWIMRSTYDDARDEYEVRLSTTGNAISDFTTILKEKAAANSYWTEVSIDLSAYDGQQCYIAIRHDYTNGFFIMVDDFGIFGWSEDIVTTDNSLLIEELLPETEYLWHVQANCGDEGGLSQWSSIDNFTTLSTCPMPIGLSASNETNHGATLDWTGLSYSYQVMVGELDGGSNEVVSWTTYTATEVPFVLDDAQHFQPGTSYTVKVKGFCDDEETDFCEPIVFTTTFSCWPVNSLSYDNLTSFSVNLSWVLEDETQTAWQICLNDNENNLIAANTNEGFLLGNLTPNVEYTVKVRANCGENDYSRWSSTITFTTPEVCATPTDLAVANITAISADLSWIGREDVESYTVRYRSTEGVVAHYIEDFSDNIDSWTMVECEPRTGIRSGAFAFYRVTDANNPNPHQYLISPELTSYITSNSVLEFKYRAFVSSYAETFMVGFSSTNNEVDSFSWSNPITVATNEYQTYHANLPAGTKYIAIQCTSYRKYYLFIDDITVGNEAIGGQWMTKTTTETEAQLINLNGGTQYEVQVRSDCNPDGWCNIITFETELDGTMVFVAEGDWNTASNWVPQGTPALNNKVIIRADVTIPSGCVAEANRILFEGTTLTIENGGQLKTNVNVEATMKKFIIGYGTDYVETDNGYYLMTLPTAAPIAAADAGLITEESDFDLYGWNRTATDEEWQNNHDGIDLQNGVGFLYANRDDMELSFTATLQRSSLPITKTPAYDEEHGGWNLYGNPFPCEAYITTDTEGLTFYRLVDNGWELIEGTIAPLEAFFVKATAAGQTFTISREAPAKSGHTSRP